MNEYRILERLRLKIIKNKHYGFNIGAVITDKKGNVLSYGFNSYQKTRPQMKENPFYTVFQIFVHAECDAIYKADKDKQYCMIVGRIDANHKFVLAKPCIGCYNEIIHSNLKKIYYTNENGELILLDTNIDIENY